MLKDVVKIAVKLGLLYRHNQFNQEEIEIGTKFRKKFKTCAFTMMSYHDVAFTFDEDILSEAFEECKGKAVVRVRVRVQVWVWVSVPVSMCVCSILLTRAVIKHS